MTLFTWFLRSGWRNAATIQRFWTTPIRAEPLALHRMLLAGLGLVYVFCYIAPRLDFFWGPDGLYPWTVVDDYLRQTGRWCVLRPSGFPWLANQLPADWVENWQSASSTRAVLGAAFVVWVLALTSVAVGFATRWATLLAWLFTASFFYMAPHGLNGGDDILIEGLFYLLLTPAGAKWSIDAWRCGQSARTPVYIAPWSVRLIQIQVVFMYLFTGISKIGPDWWEGDAIYWVLQDYSLTRWPYAWVPVPIWLCRLLSWGTLVFEVGFPLLILFQRVRPWLLGVGVLLHISIYIGMDVGWFSPFTLCWYALFLSPRCLDNIFRKNR